MPKSPISDVIFDWAGTTVDHGCLAPVRTLQSAFARQRIDLSGEVARRDMGIAKKDDQYFSNRKYGRPL